MKNTRRILPALVASLFAAFGATEAPAAQISNVVVFGDSLSDAGYYRALLAAAGLPAAQMGRFTTNPDPIWAELIAQYYGITLKPSNAGGTDYAQGGARVALESVSTPPGFAQRPVSTQVTEYLASRSGAADPNALYTMWAGNNDFFAQFGALQAGLITPAQLQTNVLAAATAEVQQAGRLYAAGARNVMVFMGFDGALTPNIAAADATTRGSVTAITVGYNTTLLTSFAGAGMRPIMVDLFSLFNEIRVNPSAYGFTNITGVACGPLPPASSTPNALFCLQGLNTTATAANTFMFADGTGHLTSASNRIIAQFAEQLIEGPYNYSQLAEAPLRTRLLHVQGVAEGMRAGQTAELGKYTAFFASGGGQYDVESGVGNSGVSNNNEAYTIGVTVRASEAVTLGGAFGQTKGRGVFGMGMGDYHTRDYNYSLFGAVRMGGFYADAVGTIADVDFSDMHRNITLGAQTRTANASTTGSNASVFLNAGWDFRFGNFTIGPVVSATWQDVEVAGFDEANAGSANLRIMTQKRRSQVWSGGLKASADIGGWQPWIRVTADKEQENDPRYVTAMPLTLVATNSQYDILAYAPDTSYTTIMGGIRTALTKNVLLGVSYYTISGRSGINEWGAAAALTYKF